MVPSHHSISVTPWYQVCNFGIGQFRIYSMFYPRHLAAYVVMTLPNGTFWCPQT